MDFKFIPEGTVTSPRGFLAGAILAGIKARGDLDLGLLYSQAPCRAYGLFTTNKVKAAPIALCQRHLKEGKARAIVVNSGCANACIGEQGARDAAEMAALAARRLGLSPEEVLVASTGVIGVPLPMERIREGLERIELSPRGGQELARAIMTTDTFPKERAVSLEIGGKKITIGGMAKGAGMIHPNLATLLCFLTTDALVEANFLEGALRRAVEVSFNMISIDGDTSPNDSLLLLANGLAGNQEIRGGPEGEKFEEALGEVCLYLAKAVASDGEGATKLIEVTVEGALSTAEARLAARTVVSSPLVKAAVHGADPNWGRILAALGRSGAEVVLERVDLYLDNLCLLEKGRPLPWKREEARALLKRPQVPIRVSLNLGPGRATAWGCDLAEEYVTINSAYTT